MTVAASLPEASLRRLGCPWTPTSSPWLGRGRQLAQAASIDFPALRVWGHRDWEKEPVRAAMSYVFVAQNFTQGGQSHQQKWQKRSQCADTVCKEK